MSTTLSVGPSCKLYFCLPSHHFYLIYFLAKLCGESEGEEQGERRGEERGFNCRVLSEIVIYLQHLFSLRDIIEIDRGCILYLLIALSSKCSLNARIKDYVQLISQRHQFIRYLIIHDQCSVSSNLFSAYYHLPRNH